MMTSQVYADKGTLKFPKIMHSKFLQNFEIFKIQILRVVLFKNST